MPGRPLRRFAITALTDEGPNHLHVAAASVRQATRMARAFFEFVDHGEYQRLEVEGAKSRGRPSTAISEPPFSGSRRKELPM